MKRHLYEYKIRYLTIFGGALLPAFAFLVYSTISVYQSERRAIRLVTALGGLVTCDRSEWWGLREGLTEIDWSQTKVSDADLSELGHCPRLKRLDLVGTRISGAGLRELVAPNLESLTLDYSTVQDKYLSAVDQFPALKELTLDGTSISDAGLQSITHLEHLEYLSIAQTRISDTGIVGFETAERLQSIMMTDTRITDVSLAHLSRNCDLRELWIGGTDISDEASAYIVACKNLQLIDLGRTGVTDKALRSLSQCPKLRSVYLGNTPLSDDTLSNACAIERS